MTAKRECSEKAYHSLGNWGQWDPCSRKATVERDGKWYCWQHDPERIEADKKKRRAAWDAKYDKKAAVYERRARNARLGPLVTEELAALLEQLADYALEAARKNYTECPDDVDGAYIAEETTRATAARIREILDEH